MILDPVDLLAELVKIPSVNPMGREALGPPYLEGRLTDYLEGLLQRLGLAVERQSVLPGRENLLAVLPGEAANADGPVILLDAHQDTVPVDGMTVEPFGAEIRDGRLYGRGACDVKGGMAAILAAV
jgi:acetylornithine deacetylase